MMAFPNKKTLDEMRKQLESSDGTLMLPENPSKLEVFRWEICQQFVKFKKKNKVTLEEIGEVIGTDKGKVSKILRHRIDEFSTDRLLSYLEILNPETRLKVG